jgi:hypothetical protein
MAALRWLRVAGCWLAAAMLAAAAGCHATTLPAACWLGLCLAAHQPPCFLLVSDACVTRGRGAAGAGAGAGAGARARRS